MDQHWRDHVHPAGQLPAAPALRPSPVRQRAPHGHHAALRALHAHAAALHRLPRAGQRRGPAGQGRAGRGDGGTDGAADRRDRTRRAHRPHRRTGHHRRAHPGVPARLPRRRAGRLAARRPAAGPAAQPQRALQARGRDPVVPGDGDDPPHPRHPRPRPGGQGPEPHGRHPGPPAHLRPAPGPRERPLRLAVLGRAQRGGRPGPRGRRADLVPRRLGSHRRRRRHAERLPDHAHHLHHDPGGAGPGHHQGPGVRPFGRRGPPGARTGGERGQDGTHRPARRRGLRGSRPRLRERRPARGRRLHPDRRTRRDDRPGGSVRRRQVHRPQPAHRLPAPHLGPPVAGRPT